MSEYTEHDIKKSQNNYLTIGKNPFKIQQKLALDSVMYYYEDITKGCLLSEWTRMNKSLTFRKVSN